MNIKKAAVYCPVCGLVVYLKIDNNNEIIFPDNFPEKKCFFCNHEMIRCPEPFENFYFDYDNIDDAMYVWDTHVLKNHILNNAKYDKAAHIRRLQERIELEANTGWKAPKEIKILKEICGVDIEQPEVIPQNTPWWAYSSGNSKSSNANEVKCPRCGSTSIATQKKGFGVGKAAAGVLTLGLAGALAGGIGANKAVNICQNCGHKWEPGK